MPDLFLPGALLPDGWARDVRVGVADDGTFSDVRADAAPEGATVVRGVGVPGVPNVHSHAFQRAMAGLAERGSASGDTFWSWRSRMYAFLAELGPDDVEAIAAQLYVELLRHGYTAVAEFHYLRNQPDGTPYDDPIEMGRRLVRAAGSAGIGLTLLPVLYAASDFGGAPPEPAQRRFRSGVQDALADLRALDRATAGLADASVGLALHSLRAVPPGALEEAVEGARDGDRRRPLHIHVAEQRREVDACVAWSGQRPVAWLLDHAPVDEGWCLVHGTHVDSDELQALGRSGAVVGLCPTTEANLGDGVFPLAEHRAGGGAWAVGSDSHVSVSPVAELRLLEYGQRLTRLERNVAAGPADRSSGRVLLEGAWSGGSRATGRPLGALRAGARADLVVLDPDHPALAGRGRDALLDSWIFSGEDTPVRDVMVGGAWVVEDGRHPRQDEIAAAYRRVAERLAR